MCYSAEVEAEYRLYVREHGATLSIKEYFDIFWRRKEDPSIKIPKAMEAPFLNPTTDQEKEIKGLIDAFNNEQKAKFEAEFFTQRTRLLEAERKLQLKTTKGALESQRIATNKIANAQLKLSDLRRSVMEPRDARIFPLSYAPVIVSEEGRRVIKPMRYQCRLAGKPAFYDEKFPGTYNARRDNLEGFWKPAFGRTHGIMIVNTFYENVSRVDEAGEAKNVVLKFQPQPAQQMLVACLWSHWTGPDQPDLLSFAAITDEPPAEVAAAGHDRCIVPIKPEHVDAWLNPVPGDLARMYAILDDRARPYYEHRLAA
jgi:putative SOS response-associated peptidase YedK